MKFFVLGGYGIIGRTVVSDLFKYARNSEIIVAGRDFKKALEYSRSFKSTIVKAIKTNIEVQEELVDLLKDADVCVNCVQYYLNIEIMRACLKARVHYVDLGGLFHCTKKQFKLYKEFKRIGKTAILGIGAAPGISNLLSIYGSKLLKIVKSVEIVFADKDYMTYKQKFVLPYSFKTIIDEYTMKPAVLRESRIIFVSPHSGNKEYNFGEEFGRKEGFLTLHSEIATLPFSLKNKGIKNCEFRISFPKEFSETILNLIDLGFTSSNKIKINNNDLKIIDITSKIMDKLVPLGGTKVTDKEIVRVILKGEREIIMDAITESDNETSAGVLDTGIPCSIANQMLASGSVEERGVFPPEKIFDPEKFFKELAIRKIKVLSNGERIN